MFDPVCKLGCNEVLLNEGAVLEGTLTICFQKLQLLGNIRALLVVLAVSMHIGKESPVFEVIDGVLKEGVCCSVASEMTVEPGG